MIPPVTNKHGTEISVGQFWADADPRHRDNRVLLIEGISFSPDGKTYANCMTYKNGICMDRMSDINIDRLNHGCRGYALINPHDIPKKDKALKVANELARAFLNYMNMPVKDQSMAMYRLHALATKIVEETI